MSVADEAYLAADERVARAATPDEVYRTLLECVRSAPVEGEALLFLQSSEGAPLTLWLPRDSPSLAAYTIPDLPRWRRRGTLLIPEAAGGACQELEGLLPLLKLARAGALVHAPVGPRAVLFFCTGSEPTALRETAALVHSLAAHASGVLERLRLQAVVQALSLTDSLTGLASRRQLQLMLDFWLAAADRGRSLTLVAVERVGLPASERDELHRAEELACIAATLRTAVRRSDLKARYGEESFVLVLMDSTRVGGWSVVARLKQRLAERVRICSGTAEFGPDGDTAETLLERAFAGLRSQRDALG